MALRSVVKHHQSVQTGSHCNLFSDSVPCRPSEQLQNRTQVWGKFSLTKWSDVSSFWEPHFYFHLLINGSFWIDLKRICTTTTLTWQIFNMYAFPISTYVEWSLDTDNVLHESTPSPMWPSWSQSPQSRNPRPCPGDLRPPKCVGDDVWSQYCVDDDIWSGSQWRYS